VLGGQSETLFDDNTYYSSILGFEKVDDYWLKHSNSLKITAFYLSVPAL
jgi:hypothetical protein